MSWQRPGRVLAHRSVRILIMYALTILKSGQRKRHRPYTCRYNLCGEQDDPLRCSICRLAGRPISVILHEPVLLSHLEGTRQ
jgi:hypothetical protein